MPPFVFFGTNLPCKYVLCIVYSGMVWLCKGFFYENRSCLHALMLNYNFMCVTSWLMFYNFWTWLCPVCLVQWELSLWPSPCLYSSWAGGGSTNLLWQSFRIVQRSCTGGLGIYSRSAVCRGVLISLGIDKQPSDFLIFRFSSTCCPAFWCMHGLESARIFCFLPYRVWWRGRIPA